MFEQQAIGYTFDLYVTNYQIIDNYQSNNASPIIIHINTYYYQVNPFAMNNGDLSHPGNLIELYQNRLQNLKRGSH
jgi:hypothetical protein